MTRVEFRLAAEAHAGLQILSQGEAVRTLHSFIPFSSVVSALFNIEQNDIWLDTNENGRRP